MSIFNSTKFGVASLITATSIVGAAVGLSVPAKADTTELAYLQALNARGLVVYDTVAALRTGYAICETLNAHNGNAVAAAVYAVFPELTPRDAYAMVDAAVVTLCPWHDHRGFTA